MAEPSPGPTARPVELPADAAAPPSALRRLFGGWRLNALLFVATVLSTLWVGGLAYCLTLIGILLAHEMGHYVVARHYRVDASLPYFIPIPIAFGTFGAVIRMDDRIPDRKALIAIGAAGPLAGMVVALPLLFYGLTLSQVVPLTGAAHTLTDTGLLHGLAGLPHLLQQLRDPGVAPILGTLNEGNSLLYLGAKHLVFHLGPGQDVWISQVAFAAWIGLFVTALNMIPVAQLDGGHVVFGLFGDRAHVLNDVVRGILLGLALTLWWGWLMWVVIITVILRLSGGRHPPVEHPERPLPRWTRVMAWVSLVVLVLTFSPIPMRSTSYTAAEAKALPAPVKQAMRICDPLIDWEQAHAQGKAKGPPPACP